MDEVLLYGIGIIADKYRVDELTAVEPVNVIVLPRGTPVPCRQAMPNLIRTSRPLHRTISLTIGIGDSGNPAECDQIARSLDVGEDLPKGTRFRLVLSVDENLLLTIEAQRENAGSYFTTVSLPEVLQGSLQFVEPSSEGA